MSHIYSIDHTPTAVEDVSVEISEKSGMTLQKVTTDPKTGEVTAVYILTSGDFSYPATVTYRSTIQNRSDGQMRRISVTLSTWAVDTDSVSGLDTRKGIQGTISLLIPADLTLETADLNVMLGNMFSYMYPSIATKLRNTGYLQKLLYGVAQVV
jgi:hypothetical protein